MIQLAVLQYAPVFGDKSSNLDRVEALLTGLAADLVVLPELFASGYLFNSAEELAHLAEPIPDGPTVSRLRDWSRRLHAVFVAGIAEAAPDGFYNSAVIIDARNDLVDVYRKIHLFAEERRWFRPGNLGLRVWETRGLRIGVMVCFDWVFPEASRILALKGAQVIAHPANLVLPYCQRAMPIRSLENGVFIATANRTGEDRRGPDRVLRFTGQSLISTPEGEVLVQLDANEERVAVVEIDPTRADDKWITAWNHLFRDRRPDMYESLTRPFPNA